MNLARKIAFTCMILANLLTIWADETKALEVSPSRFATFYAQYVGSTIRVSGVYLSGKIYTEEFFNRYYLFSVSNSDQSPLGNSWFDDGSGINIVGTEKLAGAWSDYCEQNLPSGYAARVNLIGQIRKIEYAYSSRTSTQFAIFEVSEIQVLSRTDSIKRTIP